MPTADGLPEERSEEDYPETPWHFKVLVVALVLYLAYRLIQLLVWIVGAVF